MHRIYVLKEPWENIRQNITSGNSNDVFWNKPFQNQKCKKNVNDHYAETAHDISFKLGLFENQYLPPKSDLIISSLPFITSSRHSCHYVSSFPSILLKSTSPFVLNNCLTLIYSSIEQLMKFYWKYLKHFIAIWQWDKAVVFGYKLTSSHSTSAQLITCKILIPLTKSDAPILSSTLQMWLSDKQ